MHKKATQTEQKHMKGYHIMIFVYYIDFLWCNTVYEITITMPEVDAMQNVS